MFLLDHNFTVRDQYQESVHEFKDALNSFHLFIKFTVSLACLKNSSFQDVTVIKSGG